MNATEKQKENNYTIAEKLGCDFTTVSRLRNGNRLPGRDLMLRMHTILGLPLETLVEKVSEGPKAFGKWFEKEVFDGSAEAGTSDSAGDPGENEDVPETVNEVVADDESKTA